jgi:hypothetical protein
MQRTYILHIGLIAVILLCNVRWLPIAWADGINFRTNQRYTNSSSQTKLKDTGESFDSDFYRWDQLYDLDISKRIYPYLNFATGAVYEYNQSKSTGEDTRIRATQKILRPYAELNLNNPLYQAGITFRKRRIEEDISDRPDTQNDRDEMMAVLGMNPDPMFPKWDLRYTQVHTYDHPETIDVVDKQLDLNANYSVWESLLFDYLYTYINREDRLLDFDTDRQTHFGKIDYSHLFFDGRLSANTGYRIRYETFEFPSSAVVESPLGRSAGLSSLDNKPEDGPALSLNNSLIDGNVVASAGLDIGTAGDQATQVNIGIDFGLSPDVDALHVWVDRNLTAVVANSFAWSVYTSPDNRDDSDWTLIATVVPAAFGTFDNRFEISFPVVNTRFIKVVTAPLSPAAPGAADFTNIFITELQAFVTQTGAEVDNKQTNTDHNYNLNLRGRLTDKTTVGYNLLYSLQERDPSSDKRTELANGVFLNHTFDPIFSINANGQRTDTSFLDEDIIAYNYGASLKAGWLNTFNQSLTYSGIYEDLDEGTAFQNSIFLRNNATLYKGWSVFVDTGYSWSEPVTGERVTSTIINGGTNLIPNSKLTLNLNYRFKRTDQSGLNIGPKNDNEVDIQAFYNPFRSMSIFARLNIIDRGDDTHTFQTYSVNWSPFPDGDLQLFFLYTEQLRSQDDSRDTIIGPGLKYSLGRHFFLDMTYNYTRNENDVQKTESNVFNGLIRMVF